MGFGKIIAIFVGFTVGIIFLSLLLAVVMESYYTGNYNLNQYDFLLLKV